MADEPILDVSGMRREINKEIAEIGKDAERKARSLAPVGTGTLSRNIYATSLAEQRFISAQTRIGPNRRAFYGRFIERGTKHMKAQPFLDKPDKPALDDAKVTSRILDAIIRGI